jgi:hypothetical protein
MIPFCLGFLIFLGMFFRSHYNLSFEILALRQQLGVLKQKNPRSPGPNWLSLILASSITVPRKNIVGTVLPIPSILKQQLSQFHVHNEQY